MTAFRQIAARLAAGMGELAEPADPMLGGLGVRAWFEVYFGTHEPTGMGVMRRVEWPEAGGFADQPAVLVEALDEVGAAVLKASEDDRRRSAGQWQR